MRKSVLLTLIFTLLGHTSLFAGACYGPITSLNKGDNVEVALNYMNRSAAYTDFIGSVVEVDLTNCVLNLKSTDFGTLLIDGNSILYVVDR